MRAIGARVRRLPLCKSLVPRCDDDDGGDDDGGGDDWVELLVGCESSHRQRWECLMGRLVMQQVREVEVAD